MTSLKLFYTNRINDDLHAKSRLDWGTGKVVVPICRPQSPRLSGTFLCNGEPTSQNYRNTDITLSNVRLNDELVPSPLHTTNIASHENPLKFPSNHPYTSHISEKALFPTGSCDENDRPSTYSDPFIVTHKCRSNPFRREVHYHGFQRDRHRILKWPDQHYMQLPRSKSDANSFPIYPWPRKMLAPNQQTSTTDDITTNIVKNKERTFFETTYQNDFTHSEGLGTHVVLDTTATYSPTESLKPHFQKTFDPAKPVEGKQSPMAFERSKTSLYSSSIILTKPMSENERLDDQLRYGTDYTNLPENRFPTDVAPTWTTQREPPADQQATAREIRFLPRQRPATAGSQLARDRYASHQQMDAENRLQRLELIGPKENIDLLNQKFRHLQHPRHARPILPQYRDPYINTLYDQIGTYVQERSGLYHTDNYNPSALTQAIPELEHQNQQFDSNGSETNLDDLLRRTEQIQQRGQPKLFQEKAIGDYQTMRNHLLDKLRVPQDASSVDSRTQEGPQPFVQRETIYGQTYNTRKFLQENVLPQYARIDPSKLMSSNYNTNLERVRTMNSFPRKSTEETSNNNEQKQRSETTLVSSNMYPGENEEVYKTKMITEHTDGYARRPTVRVYDSPFKGEADPTIYQLYSQQKLAQSRSTSFDPIPSVPGQLHRAVKTMIRLPGPEIVARYVEPNVETKTTYQRSYKDVSYHESIPQSQTVIRPLKGRSISMKDVSHQTSTRSSENPIKLREIQDRWSKSQAQQEYHRAYPEPVPDVSGSTIRAKKEILIADTIAKRGMITVR